jgi:hypothetical protein
LAFAEWDFLLTDNGTSPKFLLLQIFKNILLQELAPIWKACRVFRAK